MAFVLRSERFTVQQLQMSNIYPGLCFYYQNPESPTPHMWIILTEVHGDSGTVICVNLSSVKSLAHDQTVVLNPGDHRDIKVPSFAYYRKASAFRESEIERYLIENPEQRAANCSPLVLNRLRLGLLQSDQTREKIFDYCLTLKEFSEFKKGS